MSIFSFTNPLTGQPFEIKGPPTLTESQAKQIFDQQLDAGSLVGLKKGDIISSATQAAAGLTAALPQLGQTLAGIGGSASGMLQGALKSIPGTQLPAAGSIVNQITGGLQTASGIPGGGLSSLIDQGKSVANQTLNGITSAIKGISVTDGINAADFAKQTTALVGIGGLAVPDVTASLAQVGKLVGQASDTITNVGGLGTFGLDASQLEISGLLKPGTASSFLASGVNSLTSVLKSPTVWTGKDGISSMGDLLSNLPKQGEIQQSLMASGLDGIKQLGVPTNLMNPAVLAGTITNAAKSVTDTVDWAKGKLPTDLQSAFSITARDVGYAVDFADVKLPEEWKEQEIPVPSIDTVNRDTLNAAASRVTGNKKIPPVSYNTAPPATTAQVITDSLDIQLTAMDTLIDQFSIVASKSDAQRTKTNSYRRDIDFFNGLVADGTGIEGQLISLKRRAEALDPPSPGTVSKIEQAISTVGKIIKTIQSAVDKLEQYLATLLT